MRCVDCANLDLHKYPKHSKVGLGWCPVLSPQGITAYTTLTHEHECSKFSAAPADVVAKRIAWVER